jgi:hypothetical protein
MCTDPPRNKTLPGGPEHAVSDLVSATFVCGYCGQLVETSVDASAGASQSYVEDCTVCCRPNVLRVRVESDTGEAEILAEFEG